VNQIKLNGNKSGRSLLSVVIAALFALLIVGAPVLAQEATPEMSTLPNIVLVHGA
jgi:hypothetical protein